MRRSLMAGLVVAVVALALTGCYPTAANAINDLERFALGLEGVDHVETLIDEPENMAFPFGGTAIGIAAVHLDENNWQQNLPVVALAVQDWLATEQKRDKVELSAGIVFPTGAIGLADAASDTRDRLELVELLSADPSLTGYTVGFSPYGSVDADNAGISISLGREVDTSIASILTEWSPPLREFAPGAPLDIVVDPDLTDTKAGGAEDLRRDLETDNTIVPDAPVVTWVDAVDSIETVTGWRVTDGGEATVYATEAAVLDSLEAELGALPGFEAITSLTLVSPELTVEGGDAAGSPAARELATALAAAGISDVSLSGGVVTVDSLDTAGARVVLTTAAAIPGAESVPLDLTISLGEASANPCGCIRVGSAPSSYLADVLPPLLDLDPQSLDSIWVRGETAVDASYTSDNRAAMSAFLAAVHDQAIARATSIAVSSDEGGDYYIVMFDAAPQITADDVWAGNNDTPQDKRHAAVIELWNALDN